ncbi:hypothetical protein BDV95DRAFT_601832 [Massariosphaeria phaeospora]|uniref:Bacteriophage T5 Orf172 DNA-binding domain-containing protein n=1 Tax=Massariosphaeria phaeospora TaxID=100035 RepID=A0A7C8IE75_9PLEO|nr:hypothetical protein BDV95DRAFT_601832 [Massariosphaeria phaeospora]
MSLTPLLEESMRELPGRFPLYAPSVTSITDRAVRELRPRTPRLTAIGTGPSQGDFTAPASACRRPRFSGAQSDLLPQRRRRQRSLPDRQADPYYTPTGSRPFETRRAVSDTRYNSNRRDLPADHGSPIRIIRRKCQLPSRYTNQPENDQGLDSDASPPPSPVSAQRVHNELRTCLTKDLTPDSRAGVVYILRAENSRLLKIGSTMNFKRRLQELQRDYGRKLETVLVSEFLENYARVEKLAQADLWHLCRPFKCPCATEHREWHEVDETVAINTVQRWVDFMREQQPYDETSGKLKHIWKHLLSKSRLATTRDHESG